MKVATHVKAGPQFSSVWTSSRSTVRTHRRTACGPSAPASFATSQRAGPALSARTGPTAPQRARRRRPSGLDPSAE